MEIPPAQICVARTDGNPTGPNLRRTEVSRLFGAFSAGRGFPGFPAWFRRRIRGGGLPGFPAWFRRRIGADDCAMEDDWLVMKEVAAVVGRVPPDVPIKMRLPRKHRKTVINNMLKEIYVLAVPLINTCLLAARSIFENPTYKNVVKDIEDIDVIRDMRISIESYSKSAQALIDEAQFLGERIFYIPRVHQYALSYLGMEWPTWPTVDDAEGTNDQDVFGAGNDKAEVDHLVKAESIGSEAEAGAHKEPEKQGGPIIPVGSSSKGESSGSSFVPPQHEKDDMDELTRAKYVYSMFPKVSRDSIDELLKANDFDISRTVEMLEARVARANSIYSMFPNVSINELELTIDMLRVLLDNVEGINNLPNDAEASNDLNDDTDVPGAGNDKAEVYDPVKAGSVGAEAEVGGHKAPEKQGGPIISAEPSSKGESSGSSFDTAQHEEDDMGKKARVAFVYSMFPNVSTYSIDELLKANDFDMNRTVRMLSDNAKASNALHDDKDVLGADNQKAEVSDPIKARVNLVYAMFPNISSNSIDGLLEANDFDVEETIDMLRMLDDNAGDINMVYARFPNDSREFIDELLKANDFDIEQTIAMLDEMNSPP